VQSAITVQEVAEPYIRRRAMRHLEKGRVVIFAAGTGNPFFTTDTAAALRASEIHAEAILMAKNGVEGVYSADPALDPTAEFIPQITHMEAIQRRLAVMDATALTLCMENKLPIRVFNVDDDRNIGRILAGEQVGTLVSTPGRRYTRRFSRFRASLTSKRSTARRRPPQAPCWKTTPRVQPTFGTAAAITRTTPIPTTRRRAGAATAPQVRRLAARSGISASGRVLGPV
jgi:hypothetical protein